LTAEAQTKPLKIHSARKRSLEVNPLTFTPRDEVEAEHAMASPIWRMSHLYKILIKGDDDSEDDTSEGLVTTFVPNAAQMTLFNEFWHRNILLKARQLGMCLDPTTPVLTADLRWVSIGDLEVGQEVVSVDECRGKGRARQMRTATVQAAIEVKRQAFRITFDDGRQVVCTDRHPWLTRDTCKRMRWRSLSGKGNQVKGRIKVGTQVRWITRGTWGDGSYEDGWMGGMLDGEGSMALSGSPGAEVNVAQVQGPAFGRMEMYLAMRGYAYRTEIDVGERKSKHGSLPVHKLCVSRMDEMFRLIGQTRPTRFVGRRFWDGKEMPGKRSGGVGWSKVVEIEPLGEQTMIDLQTSTGTYIANGFVSHNTTAITIYFLDSCLFRDNVRAGMIAQTDPIAKKLFRDKVKFAYDNLAPALKRAMPLERESAEELMFKHNGSSIQVSTSMRSGTLQYLHVSEFGKICADFPKRADEVVTGSIPTVPSNGVIFIESTAEGREGHFYNMSRRAEAMQHEGRRLSRKDYKFFFFSWFLEPRYRAAIEGVRMTDADHTYFDSIEASESVTIDLEQRAWYVSTRDSDFSGDEELMFREYPSTPAEAFHQSTRGTYYSAQFTALRKQGRIKDRLPVEPSVPCMTFWDIGNSDGTAVWVVQKVGHEWRCIDFYEEWGEPYSDATKWLQDLGLTWEVHYLPHDADHVRQGQTVNKSPREMLEELMPGALFETVPRIHDVNWGIQQTRDIFPLLYFDGTKCAEGIEHLELYRRKWNVQQGAWSDQPDKTGGHSEAADALRQLAQAYAGGLINVGKQTKPKRRGSWRTV